MRLESFVREASPEQVRAWGDSIPPLQREVDEVLVRDALAKHYSAILEYELPLESRRPDVVLLLAGSVLVIELKGKVAPSQADIDQAAAYARDLRCYHRECADRPVVPVLVPTRARGYVRQDGGVHIAGPDAVDGLVATIVGPSPGPVIDRQRFLDETAYCPLPTLVEAARELFRTGDLRKIRRARAATEPAVDAITDIIHEAAATRTRHLVLLTGIPGSGKTLVGLQVVHAHYLDDLAVPRAGEKPAGPAMFLSGNRPLVEVLQYELRAAGGAGKTFVRHVIDYVATYSSARRPVPPQHVLVFDEAQRAYDAAMVAETHRGDTSGTRYRSEPEHFIEFAERIPAWCVVIGLIGTGQEINRGEEGGLVQWREAIEGSPSHDRWTAHAPLAVADEFEGSIVAMRVDPRLNLNTELRFHRANAVPAFVDGLLSVKPVEELQPMAAQLAAEDYHLRLTRSLERAKGYLKERYREDQDARFGLIASSRDKALEQFGVPNGYQSTKQVRIGAWYSDPESAFPRQSCRHLEICVTEFGAQGLELDAVLLAWGTDLVLEGGVWSIARSRRHQKPKMVRDAKRLRLNAYRVLLTRARDACVVFVPPLPELDETFEYLSAAGFKLL